MKNIAAVTAPNPQGKANLPLLQLLESSTPVVASNDTLSDIELLSYYLASTLVLSAEFRFEPRPGHTYYLYWHQERKWQLSMIEPEADRQGRFGEFYATCVLGKDWLWQLHQAPAEQLSEHVLMAVADFMHNTAGFLAEHRDIDAQLPWFQSALPFYRRLAARALACRLRPQLGHNPLPLLEAYTIPINGNKRDASE